MVGALVRDSKEVDSVSAIPRVVAEACNPQVQDLIILPTEKCNFRCTYCYEDFAVGKMSEAVQRAVEQFMSNRIPDLAQLSIKWFGGEPLVAKAVVLRLSAHAKSLCDQHGVGLSGGLTTNAWLLDYATFSELVSYDQRFFQITLDGWKDVHDTFRRRANGRGTFDRIWENLLATRESDDQFEIQLRVHIRRGDQGSIEELLQHIAAEFGNDPRYSIDFEHIRNLGGEGGKTVANPLSLDELKAIERDLRAFYERQIASYHPSMARCAGGIPDPSVDTVESASASSLFDGYVCYASKPNSLLIRADGRLGKCTVALTDDRNTIGKLNDDGSVFVEKLKLQPWIRGLRSLDEAELGCPLGGLPR